MKDNFRQSINNALKHFVDAEWLGVHSPLASPYFLGQQLQKVTRPDTHVGRGEALQLVMQTAVDSIWPGPLPQSRQTLEAAVNEEREGMGNGGPCYLYLLLDLRYFRRFFSPRSIPNTVRGIHDYLSVSETRFFVHLSAAREQFTKELLYLIRPSLRLEKPILTTRLVGRNKMMQDIMHHLQGDKSVSLSGLGGIGKTSLGTAVIGAWKSKASFWYTFHPGLNDDVNSLIFSLGHFLHQWGYSNLWFQLMAQGGKTGSVEEALGFLREDLAQAAELPILLCFDELDLLQTAVSQPRHSEHRQILELLEGLKKLAPMLLIGQRMIIDTEAHFLLNQLSIEAYEQLIAERGFVPENLHLKQIYRLTHGNPRFLEIYLALLDEDDDSESVNLLNAPSLKPTFSRLWKRLTKDEKVVLSQLAVFRNYAPADLWDGDMAYQTVKSRRLLKEDAFGGITILSLFRELIYEELPLKTRYRFHYQAARVRSERGQTTEAAYHLCRSNKIDDAIALWYAKQDIEIEQGKAGAAYVIFSDLSPRGLLQASGKKLKIIKDRLNLLYGRSAEVLKDIDKYSWHLDDELTAVELKQRGDANHHLGNIEQALQNYEDAIKSLTHISNQITFLTVRRGQLSLEQGKLYEAENEGALAQFELLRLHGLVNMTRGNYLKAKGFFEDALALAQKISNEEKVATASYSLALMVGNAGDPDLAQEIAKPALDYFKKIGNRVQLEGLKAELAGTYLNAGRFDEAIIPIEKALQFFEKIKHDVLIGHLSSNLAEAYFETGNIDQAEQYAYKAINSEHLIVQPYAIYTLGQIHAAKQKFTLAEQAFETGIELARQIGDQFIEAYLHRISGQILLKNMEYEAAKNRIKEALGLFAKLSLQHEIDKTEQILSTIEDKP